MNPLVLGSFLVFFCELREDTFNHSYLQKNHLLSFDLRASADKSEVQPHRQRGGFNQVLPVRAAAAADGLPGGARRLQCCHRSGGGERRDAREGR